MIFEWLRARFTKAGVVELSSERLRVRAVARTESTTTLDFEPILSINADNIVVSVGRPIAVGASQTYAPFSSPSALQRDEVPATMILLHALQSLAPSWFRMLRVLPRVVVHVSPGEDNAIRHVDDAAVRQLFERAGAMKVRVHRGRALSDTEACELLGI